MKSISIRNVPENVYTALQDNEIKRLTSLCTLIKLGHKIVGQVLTYTIASRIYLPRIPSRPVQQQQDEQKHKRKQKRQTIEQQF